MAGKYPDFTKINLVGANVHEEKEWRARLEAETGMSYETLVG